MLSQNTTPVTDAVADEYYISSASGRVVAPWLTGEVALYIVVGVVALGLRLLSLGERPLDAVEANQALAAWRFVSGQEVGGLGYSPLMFLGNVLTFILFGSSDFSARLVPVLFGMILVLTPVLYRRLLGRWGALLASAFLAISPTAAYYSRHLSGEIAVIACALLMLGFKMRFVEDHDVKALDGVVIAGALMLTAGPGAYAFLVVGLVFAMILVVSAQLGHGGEDWDKVKEAGRVLGEYKGIGGRLLLLFALTILLVGTCLLMYFPGFQMVIDQFSAWTAQMGPVGGGVPWYHHFLLLLFYEPLILVFAVAGIVLAFIHRNIWTTFLVFWGVVALYVYTLFGGKSSGDLLLALGPLALLSGLAAGRLIENVGREGMWEIEGLFLGILAPIGVYLMLQFSGYGYTGQMPYLWLFGVGSLLALGLFAGYLFWLGPRAAGRSLGLAALIFLILVTWGTNWNLNYVHVSDPREIMITRPTHTAMRDLVAALEEMSVWRSGDRHELPLSVVEIDDPAVRWYVRDFRDVRHVGTVGENPETQVYITPLTFAHPVLEETYRGEQFALRSDWLPPTGLRGPELIKWWLYRQSPSPESLSIILWAKGGGGLGSTAR